MWRVPAAVAEGDCERERRAQGSGCLCFPYGRLERLLLRGEKVPSETNGGMHCTASHQQVRRAVGAGTVERKWRRVLLTGRRSVSPITLNATPLSIRDCVRANRAIRRGGALSRNSAAAAQREGLTSPARVVFSQSSSKRASCRSNFESLGAVAARFLAAEGAPCALPGCTAREARVAETPPPQA